jgi:branched-chain amino acid transport system substrate-binding protein
MKSATKLLCALLASMLFVVLAAGSAFADRIKVGVVLPLTGKLAKFGEIEKKSFLMAVEEINAAGGVNGKRIDLIIADTTGKPDVGRSAIEKLISRDKVIVVGGGCSSQVTDKIAALTQQYEIPFLINTASSDVITETKREFIFRLNPPASEYLNTLATFLTTVGGIKTAALLYERSPFGPHSGFSASGLKMFSRLRKKVKLKKVIKMSYEAGADDFMPLLTKIKVNNPDLVYLIANEIDASLILQQSRAIDLNPKMFFGGTSGFTLPEFQEIAWSASDYVFSTNLWTPSVPYPGAKEYYDKFVARYNSPTEYHGAEAYAGMYVIADALKRAKPLTPEGVRNALAETDMMTAFGPVKFISYGKKTQQNKLPTFLVQWINGNLETVWPKDISTHKYVYPVPKWYQR